MEAIQHVRKTDLARQTRQIIRDVQGGQHAIVENHGRSEVVIIDICDYWIMRAVIRYYAQPMAIDSATTLTDKAVLSIPSQQRYDLVLAHYLAGAISFARAAELLVLPWLDLHARCLRLDVPLRMASAEEQADIEMAMA